MLKARNILLIAVGALPLFSAGQTVEKIAAQAFMVTRMVNKYHVQPRAVDKSFSADVFTDMLENADQDRMFFTAADLSKLNRYRNTLDDEITRQKTGYVSLFINLYKLRLQQTDSLVDVVAKSPFDFYAPEKLTEAEDTSFAVNIAARQIKVSKKMKAWALDALADELPGNFKKFPAVRQKKYLDSTLTALQKKSAAFFKRRVDDILQNPYGLTQYTGNLYCKTIASCFDPHTEFFPPDDKENFESMLGKQPLQFGFSLKTDKNGGVLIDKVQPGSPAYKSGKMNKGDKFISLKWEGGQPIDVSDITIREFTDLISESNHKAALFTMKKADGSAVEVSLEKALATGNGDQDKVKGFVLKGATSIGYIYLPAFYEDWEGGNEGLNGCANDVGREILELKKQNITGLILDIRYNGGGSVDEATELAGIFTGAGPMAQEKERGDRAHAIKNTDDGIVFDGPMAVLVNGYSASASELVAGALQDYHRAVIVGAPTYGKATMQVVLPMDTTVTPENISQIHTDNYLKVTVGKLYRITGASAQMQGVQPDIVLPDILDSYITKEADEPHALAPDSVPANKYYTPLAPLPIGMLAAAAKALADTSKYFRAIKHYIAYAERKKAAKDISLNVMDVLGDNYESNTEDDNLTSAETSWKNFTVLNNIYETDRLNTDSSLKDTNDDFSKQIASDGYINIAYSILSKLKSP